MPFHLQGILHTLQGYKKSSSKHDSISESEINEKITNIKFKNIYLSIFFFMKFTKNNKMSL